MVCLYANNKRAIRGGYILSSITGCKKEEAILWAIEKS